MNDYENHRSTDYPSAAWEIARGESTHNACFRSPTVISVQLQQQRRRPTQSIKCQEGLAKWNETLIVGDCCRQRLPSRSDNAIRRFYW